MHFEVQVIIFTKYEETDVYSHSLYLMVNWLCLEFDFIAAGSSNISSFYYITDR